MDVPQWMFHSPATEPSCSISQTGLHPTYLRGLSRSLEKAPGIKGSWAQALGLRRKEENIRMSWKLRDALNNDGTGEV